MTQTIRLNEPFVLRLREKERKSLGCSSEAIIIEAVDEVFSSLGQPCKQALYFQLENTYRIKKQEIPLKIEDFTNAIEQIFGIGAKFIEMKIIEVLHEKTQGLMYFPKKKDLMFAEYVQNLRHFFMTAKHACSRDLPHFGFIVGSIEHRQFP
jgi:hypothetical protein